MRLAGSPKPRFKSLPVLPIHRKVLPVLYFRFYRKNKYKKNNTKKEEIVKDMI